MSDFVPLNDPPKAAVLRLLQDSLDQLRRQDEGVDLHAAPFFVTGDYYSTVFFANGFVGDADFVVARVHDLSIFVLRARALLACPAGQLRIQKEWVGRSYLRRVDGCGNRVVLNAALDVLSEVSTSGDDFAAGAPR